MISQSTGFPVIYSSTLIVQMMNASQQAGASMMDMLIVLDRGVHYSIKTELTDRFG